MNHKLLYFPNIDVPRNSWTIKGVLYWDEVGIITPPQFREEPERYSDFTRDLIQSELVSEVFPFNYIIDLPNFDQGFIDITRGNRFRLGVRQMRFSNGFISRIHFQKFGVNLLEELVELGIAVRQNYEWYYAETSTANLIMQYLATVIGKQGQFTPSTDNITNLPTTIRRRNMIREELLDNLMPYPTVNDVDLIWKFKENYGAELKSFRILLEQIALNISQINDPEVRRESIELKLEEINDRKEKIVADLSKPKFGKIVFGSLFSVGAAVLGFTANQPLLGSLQLGNAVYSAFQGFDDQNILDRDFSYLALIDRKFKP
jgi:hypothetical protein